MGRAALIALAGISGIGLIGLGLLMLLGAGLGAMFDSWGGSASRSSSDWGFLAVCGGVMAVIGVLFLVAVAGIGRTGVPDPAPRCRRCGHDLAGTAEGAACPGCGCGTQF